MGGEKRSAGAHGRQVVYIVIGQHLRQVRNSDTGLLPLHSQSIPQAIATINLSIHLAFIEQFVLYFMGQYCTSIMHSFQSYVQIAKIGKSSAQTAIVGQPTAHTSLNQFNLKVTNE